MVSYHLIQHQLIFGPITVNTEASLTVSLGSEVDNTDSFVTFSGLDGTPFYLSADTLFYSSAGELQDLSVYFMTDIPDSYSATLLQLIVFMVVQTCR